MVIVNGFLAPFKWYLPKEGPLVWGRHGKEKKFIVGKESGDAIKAPQTGIGDTAG
jgi:hypothetical protein